jgi:hypothetical protein
MDTYEPPVTIDEITDSFLRSPLVFNGELYPNHIRWSQITQVLGTSLNPLYPCEGLFETVLREETGDRLQKWWLYARMRGDVYRFFRLNRLGYYHAATYEMNISDYYSLKIMDKIVAETGTDMGHPTGWLH